MKKWLVMALLVSVSFNVGLLVKLAGGRDDVGRRTGGNRSWPALEDTHAWHARIDHRASHISERLGLDPGQQEAFLEHHREAADAILERRRSQQTGRRELRDIVMEQPLDAERLRQAVAHLGREQAVLDSLVAEKLLQEMEILEPEQRVEWHGQRMFPRTPSEALQPATAGMAANEVVIQCRNEDGCVPKHLFDHLSRLNNLQISPQKLAELKFL